MAKTFAETTDEERRAACFVAGHFPHLPDRPYSAETQRILFGAGRARRKPPAPTQPDPVEGPVKRQRTTNKYVAGETYGCLLVEEVHPTPSRKGFMYDVRCLKCSRQVRFTGTQLYQKNLHNHGCGCRTHQRAGKTNGQ